MPSPTNARTTTTTVVEPVPEFESFKTAAARTEISVYTLREKVASGELRAYRFSDKPGAAIRLRRTDVDALFKPVIPETIYADRAIRRGPDADRVRSQASGPPQIARHQTQI